MDLAFKAFKTSFVHGVNLKELFPHNMPEWQVAIKRFLDLLVATILLILTAPVTIAAAIAIRLDSKGPIRHCLQR